MRYQGSEAYSVDYAERCAQRQQPARRPSFEVVSGGGLDARARQGVSHQFVARVRTVLLAAALLVALGLVRVALTSATVSIMTENASLRTQISEAQTLGSDLRIERSVLSSNSRISRIATQNYGMALPTDHVTVDLSAGSDDAQAEDGAADGEAAQSGDAAGAQADMN